MARTVLCVDGQASVERIEGAIGADPSLTPISATSAREATEAIESDSIDAVVTEYDLPDEDGLDVIDRLRKEQPQTPAVLFTDTRPGDVDVTSFRETIVEYLSKDVPGAYDQLAPIVTDLIEHSAQVGYLVPDDEAERLEALRAYDVDAMPVEETFERLTDIIADHFDVEITFVGLIEQDEEQFLACHGGDWDSLTREDTICTHSMLQEDVMVVEDILGDSRFSENDTLVTLGIRSYAGANMTTPDGQVIGQVCVIDDEPRTYSERERETLQQFAEEAMEHLELRQRILDAEGGADR